LGNSHVALGIRSPMGILSRAACGGGHHVRGIAGDLDGLSERGGSSRLDRTRDGSGHRRQWTRRNDRAADHVIHHRRVVVALRIGALMLTFWEQLSDARLIALYAVGFLVMGAFVTTYNYVTYHLLDAPYRLSQSAVGLIFIVYLVGIFASAWIGARADRVGRG